MDEDDLRIHINTKICDLVKKRYSVNSFNKEELLKFDEIFNEVETYKNVEIKVDDSKFLVIIKDSFSSSIDMYEKIINKGFVYSSEKIIRLYKIYTIKLNTRLEFNLCNVSDSSIDTNDSCVSDISYGKNSV
ncbi:MAG TPA: hypothetical protein V6C58_10420 [Allocoleopsis sp.]